jgi:hypothetical protein
MLTIKNLPNALASIGFRAESTRCREHICITELSVLLNKRAILQLYL